MRWGALAIILMTATVGTGGCTKNAPAKKSQSLFDDLPVRSEDPKWHNVRLNSVRFTDDRLSARVRVDYTGSQFVKSGQLMAYALVRNLTQKPMLLEARAHFFGRNQSPLEEADEWTKVPMGPQSITPFRLLSKAKRDPAYYVIELREAKAQ